jgi:hypothetical protein
VAVLSQAQLAAYAASAGIANPQLAAAIAMAESGGDTRSHNPIPPDNSYGPWQINMLGSMGPERRKALGISSNDQLYDPAVNARAASMISKGGTDWTPWSTYTSGAYKKFLPAGSSVTQASTSGLGDGPTAIVGGVKDAVGAVGDTVSSIKDGVKVVLDAGNWISNPRNWLRIAYVGAGVLVVLVGLDVMAQTKILQTVGGALGGSKDASATESAGTVAKKAAVVAAPEAGAAKGVAAGGAKKAAAKAVKAKAATTT